MADSIEFKVEADKFEEFLANINERMQKASVNILEDLANDTLDEIRTNYSKAEYQAGETMDFVKVGSETEKTVSMVGPQAWYSEFGTGIRGESTPHPYKDQYGLNPYNSGPTIRAASESVAAKTGISVGGLYWTYKDESGEIHYTQGIPSQKEVYNAGQALPEKIPEITMKYVKEMFE